MPIQAWEAKNGKKLEDGLYRGTLRRGGHRAGCGCAEVHIPQITGTETVSRRFGSGLGAAGRITIGFV